MVSCLRFPLRNVIYVSVCVCYVDELRRTAYTSRVFFRYVYCIRILRF